jgi:hypothetical protein
MTQDIITATRIPIPVICNGIIHSRLENGAKRICKPGVADLVKLHANSKWQLEKILDQKVNGGCP